jgi:hypothetical protein
MHRKDTEVNKNVKNIFLSMCDVNMFLSFTSLNLVLLWQLLYLLGSSIVIHTVTLVQYHVSQMKMTFQEIRIIATGPWIANQLRDVNTICRRSWYIAAHYWKIYDLRHRIWYCFDNYFTYFVPVFKYCYSDSRNLWTVMRAEGLAP